MDFQIHPSEWPNLVMFHGLLESGKSTAASFLIDHGYQRVKFADPLKNMIRVVLRECGVNLAIIEEYMEGSLKKIPIPEMNDPSRPERHVTGFSDDLIWKMVYSLLVDAGMDEERRSHFLQERNRDLSIDEFQGFASINSLFSTLRNQWSRDMLRDEIITVRRMMQTLGEEWRNLHHQLLWVIMTLSKAEPMIENGVKVVIDDNRYPFEFKALSHLLPYRFVITRGDKHFQVPAPDTQPSELPMPIHWFDAHLKNDAGTTDLFVSISQYLDLHAHYIKQRKTLSNAA